MALENNRMRYLIMINRYSLSTTLATLWQRVVSNQIFELQIIRSIDTIVLFQNRCFCCWNGGQKETHLRHRSCITFSTKLVCSCISSGMRAMPSPCCFNRFRYLCIPRLPTEFIDELPGRSDKRRRISRAAGNSSWPADSKCFFVPQ